MSEQKRDHSFSVTPTPPPESDNDLIGWETLRDAVAEQPEETPSSKVEQALLAQIRVREAEHLAPPPSWWNWAWGVAVALLVAALLWATLKPGIVVEWEAQTDTSITFRLLRASEETERFQVLHTFEAHQASKQYRYVDIYVLPGQTYIYQVEAQESGNLIDERTLVVPGHVALPGQIAVLATGALVGYGAMILLRTSILRPNSVIV